MTREEALALMRQAGALEEGHFLMKSGRHADLFLQCAHLIEHADITGQLCQELAERCRDCGCDLVIAPALGGIIFGYEVSRALGKHFIYCERKDAVMTLRRGFRIPEKSRVLIVEDTVTTGGSVREVMEIIRASGAETVQVAARMLRRGMSGADVRTLQAALIAYGCSCGAAGADGDFGAGTEAALKQF